MLYKNHCIKEPWSFGAGIYTSMVQMFDQEGGELFTKVNVKDTPVIQASIHGLRVDICMKKRFGRFS